MYRFTNKAVVLPAVDSSSKPIYIPAGTKFAVHTVSWVTVYWLDCSCIYSVLVMHRRTDLWGPDGMIFSLEYMRLTDISPFNFLAHVFDPDRFLDHRVQKYLTPNPFIFCPFNAGPRICLGQQVILHKNITTHTLLFTKLQKKKLFS